MEDEQIMEQLEKYSVAIQEGFYDLADAMDEKQIPDPVNQAVECLSMSLGSIVFEVGQSEETTKAPLELRLAVYDKILDDVILTAKRVILSLEGERDNEKFKAGADYEKDGIKFLNMGKKVQCHD